MSDRSSSNSSLNTESPGSEIVTDVSDSRARLIQDLNSTLQQQRKPVMKKQGSVDNPVVPPRNTSKKEQNFSNGSKNDFPDHYGVGENLYGHFQKKEKSGHTFSAKPMLSQEILRHSSNQKARCLSQGDLFHCPKDWDQSHKQKNGKPNSGNNEILLNKTFVAALNARLAERIEDDNDDKPHIAPWLKNEKNYLTWSSHRMPQRESLMDQIKRGKRLRRVTSNDRSSPRFA